MSSDALRTLKDAMVWDDPASLERAAGVLEQTARELRAVAHEWHEKWAEAGEVLPDDLDAAGGLLSRIESGALAAFYAAEARALEEMRAATLAGMVALLDETEPN